LWNDVTNVVLGILNGEAISEVLNHAHIVLTPKKQEPKEVAKFWPISL